MSIPKWFTPVRKAHLAKVTLELGTNLENWYPDNDSDKFYNPVLEVRISKLKANWIDYDKENARCEYRFERDLRHRLICQRNYPYHSESGITHFNRASQPHTKVDSAIIRDLFYENQPCFQIVALGFSALNFKPYAKVRLAAGLETKFVDLTEALKPLSKNARRKALRYGKIPNDVNMAISHAVRRALNI